MVTIEEFIDKIKETLELQDFEMKAESSFREFPKWSSMNALIILAMFETEYDRTITGDDLRSCNTVRDLYAFL